MLAGRRYDDQDDKANPALGELCPDLAARVVGAIEGMIRPETEDATPDVPAFLALIASGDVLRRAEVEMVALQNDYAERHRIALEKYEIQRSEIETAAAEQASRLAADRAAFERLVHERQEQLAKVRSELDKQRIRIARRLTELDKRRVALEKMRADLDLREANMYGHQSKEREEFPNDLHWAIPVGLTAIALLLLAGLVASIAHPRRPASSAGEVIAPRSAPFIRRPGAARSPAVQPLPTMRDTMLPHLNPSILDTTALQPHTR
jgi:hypothetical protein